MTMRPTTFTLLALGLALAAGGTHAANLEAGKAKAQEVCQSCHGLDGNSPTPDFPRLGGQHADYLAKALRDYKSGARNNPIMKGFATGLTPKDIENVAEYYSKQPAVLESKH